MANLKAVLGPTNTGKTHYAIERMLAHTTGMIGLPLRLLAREVYDRVVAAKGPASAALVTGEERIWPESARYIIATVESMPLSHEVEFMAVDEIQLAADPDRGHIFTDRILHARGRGETLLLGSETMRPALHALGLNISADRRERFSQLSHLGPVKVTKLQKRTAIVAFSASEVYAIAELMRRQRGGAAVVMGALSPRTRNAQVELYQSGEVDYLVATDAIGMGLNLDVDHIAFASRSKFDGRRRRPLTAAETAQIAGRAGRFRSDGTFGETADCPPFGPELVSAVENHVFDAVGQLSWRNAELDFTSVDHLLKTLSAPSRSSILRQNPHALDEWTLRRLKEEGLAAGASSPERVQRLWGLCCLPDFRDAGPEGHLRLVEQVLEVLADPAARLDNDFMARRLSSLDDIEGDISQLQERVAAIRTWTYAAYRDDWLAEPENWRERTRAVEDRLSDALHEKLTQRFVDKRTSALIAGLKKEDALDTEISPEGEIKVEGHLVGKLEGLVFKPVATGSTLEGKAVKNAALAALRPILSQRLSDISHAMSPAFKFDKDGSVTFDGHAVAKLTAGHDWLSPRVEMIGAAEATTDQRDRAAARIADWVNEQTAHRMPTHMQLKVTEKTSELEGLARGIAYRVMESGAAIDLRSDDPSHRLTADQREALKMKGLRAGRVSAHAPDAQKPAAQAHAARLRTVFSGADCPRAPEGAGSFAIDERWTDEALSTAGYLRFGPRAIRADLAERLAWEIDKRRKEAGKNLFELPPELASIVSCPGADFPLVLKGFGLLPAEKDEAGVVTAWRYGRRGTPDGQPDRRPKRGPRREGQGGPAGGPRAGKPEPRGERPQRARRPEPKPVNPNNPFAVLAALVEPPKPAPKKKPKKKKPKPEPTGTPGEETAPSAGQASTPQEPPPAEPSDARRAGPDPDADTASHAGNGREDVPETSTPADADKR